MESSENHLVPVAMIAGAAELAGKLKPLVKVGEKIQSITGLGGVSQTRFIDRTNQVYKMFDDAGYKGGNHKGYKEFRIGKSDVPDKKAKGNYAPEFKRLHAYIVSRLNTYNAGLGNLWAEYFPSFKMANLGNVHSQPIEGLKEFLKAFPVGTYKIGMLPPPKEVTGVTPVADNSAVVADTEKGIINSEAAKAGLLPDFGKANTVFIIVAVVLVIATIYINRK